MPTPPLTLRPSQELADKKKNLESQVLSLRSRVRSGAAACLAPARLSAVWCVALRPALTAPPVFSSPTAILPPQIDVIERRQAERRVLDEKRRADELAFLKHQAKHLDLFLKSMPKA